MRHLNIGTEAIDLQFSWYSYVDIVPVKLIILLY